MLLLNILFELDNLFKKLVARDQALVQDKNVELFSRVLKMKGQKDSSVVSETNLVKSSEEVKRNFNH